jgi:plastocyanin
MRPIRLLLALSLLIALMMALVACGGDDALSEEEYFQKMDEIDKDLDAQFDAVFSDQEATASELQDGFLSAVDSAREQYGAVNPPGDLQDEHDELLAAIDEFGNAMSAVEVDSDAPAEEFETVFADEALSAADERVTNAFCAIQDAADESGIEADVGCDEGGDSVDPSTLPPTETTDVLIEDFAFDPPHIQVSVGDTVTWEQGADGVPHTATADDGTFDSGNLTEEGQTFEFTFEEAGEYPYICSIHPDMVGLVTVTE